MDGSSPHPSRTGSPRGPGRRPPGPSSISPGSVEFGGAPVSSSHSRGERKVPIFPSVKSVTRFLRFGKVGDSKIRPQGVTLGNPLGSDVHPPGVGRDAGLGRTGFPPGGPPGVRWASGTGPPLGQPRGVPGPAGNLLRPIVDPSGTGPPRGEPVRDGFSPDSFGACSGAAVAFGFAPEQAPMQQHLTPADPRGRPRGESG